MIRAIFADVYVQSFPQASRYNVYVVLLHFLLHRLDGKQIHDANRTDAMASSVQRFDFLAVILFAISYNRWMGNAIREISSSAFNVFNT